MVFSRTDCADAKKPQEKKTLKDEEKDKGVEMAQDFDGEMYDIPSDDEQEDQDSEGKSDRTVLLDGL